MSIKEKIIERVNAINNPEILEDILNLITIEKDIPNIYNFRKDEKESVLKGINDVKNGRVFNQFEADKITQKWLEEEDLNGL